LRDYFNDKCCICTANIGQSEVYILIFEYEKNPLFQMFESYNNSRISINSEEGNRYKLSISFEDEFKSDNMEIIESAVEKYFKRVLLFVFDNTSKELHLEYFNKNLLHSNKSIVGLLANHPNTIQDMLGNRNKQLFNDFVIGITGDSVYETVIIEDEQGEEPSQKESDSDLPLKEESSPQRRPIKQESVSNRKSNLDFSQTKYSFENDTEMLFKVKKKESLDDMRTMQEKIQSLIEILSKCVSKDKDNMKKGLPALEKLKCLPYLLKILYKPNYSNYFLQMNGLILLQEYLKKNSDGSFPCINQIEKILNLLEDLPITKEQLEECQIGGYVSEIEKNLKESKVIQRKSKLLFEKWLRVATGLDSNYASIETENEIYTKLFFRKKRRVNDSINLDEEGNNLDSKALYEKLNEDRKVPQKALFDFTFKPDHKEYIIKEEEKIARKNYFLPAKKPGAGKKVNYSLSAI